MSRSKRKRAAAQAAPEIRSLSIDGGGYSSGYTGTFALPTQAGPTVTEFTALTVAAFGNAVRIYADAISKLTFHIVKRLPKRGLEPAIYNPLYDLLSFKPNDEVTSFRYRQAGTGHLFTQGNWYSEIERKRGLPVALHLLDPRNVRPVRDDSGRLRYHLLREDRFIKPEDMLHVAGLGWDGIRGYSPVSLFRETLGLAIAEQSHTASVMGNNATPTGHIEMPGKLGAQSKGQYRDQWNAIHQGSDRSGKIAILDNGAKWVNESFSPADTELILSRSFSIAEVARIFNLPQHMLGLLDKATFSNIEHLSIEFYRQSLMPWLVNIQQEFTAKLLTPEDRRAYLIQFEPGDLLRGDTAAQIAYTDSLFNKGAMSPNEVRVYFGLNPIDDETADKHFIPVNNLAALEDLDKVLPEPPAKLDPEPSSDAQGRSVDPTSAHDHAIESIAGGSK